MGHAVWPAILDLRRRQGVRAAHAIDGTDARCRPVGSRQGVTPACRRQAAALVLWLPRIVT
jgi:hypothetical protein